MITNIEKTLTDTPILDEIVYNCKYMIMDGIYLKDEVEADSYETEESMVSSDLYLASIDGFSTFAMYKYDESDIATIPSITSKEIYQWADNNDLIPNEYRDFLFKNKRSSYIETYSEKNEYYRKYAGLPKYGEMGVMFDPESIPESFKKYISYDIPIHEHNHDVLVALENEGVLNDYIERYVDAEYLKFVGKRKMSIYSCRKAEKFAPLYVPESPTPELHTRFVELLELNRVIFLKYYYDEAYTYKSEYYEKFVMVMIILQTFCDMINEIPEYIIRKDVFDIRTVQYLFEASGVEFFPRIPMRYQLSLVRNLNKLIKFKSSDKCMVNIVELFGFKNIQAFKYYILRTRVKDENGNYKFETIENEAGDMVDDVDTNFKLEFLKVGIDELPDDAIKQRSNILDYEDVTHYDPYWRSDYDEDEVRRNILEYEFNMLRTKYMSIKSIYSMQEYMFQMSYFIGLILNNNIDKSLVLFNVPTMDMSMNIMDAFIYMYALAHVYYQTEDVIITEVDQSLKVLGFNFEADMSELATYLWEKGVKTFEDMGISDWQCPSGIFSFNQLMSVYTKNKEIYDHVVHEMLTANNKRIYDLYNKIYRSLMLTRINLDYFTVDDEGTTAKSYAEFLEYKNPSLYYKYLELSELPDETRNSRIETAIYNICCVLETYVSMDMVPYIFAGLPAASIESVKTYVTDIINFFKSFKVTILDLNTIYILDDKIQSKVIINDDWILKCLFDKKLIFPYHDTISDMKTITTHSDNMSPIDRYYIARNKYIRSRTDNVSLNDRIVNIRKISTVGDIIGIKDKMAGKKYLYDNHETDKLSGEKKLRVRKKSIYDISDRASISKESYSIRYI